MRAARFFLGMAKVARYAALWCVAEASEGGKAPSEALVEALAHLGCVGVIPQADRLLFVGLAVTEPDTAAALLDELAARWPGLVDQHGLALSPGECAAAVRWLLDALEDAAGKAGA